MLLPVGLSSHLSPFTLNTVISLIFWKAYKHTYIYTHIFFPLTEKQRFAVEVTLVLKLKVVLLK